MEEEKKPKLFGLSEFLNEPQPEEFDFRDLMPNYYEYYYVCFPEGRKDNSDYETLRENLKEMSIKIDPVTAEVVDPVKMWHLYKTLDENRKFQFDCDNASTTCQLSEELYKALWTKEVLEQCKKAGNPKNEKIDTFIGDTMNSVSTTLNKLTGLKKSERELENQEILKCRISEKRRAEGFSESLEKSIVANAIEFIRVAHTIGNFIPVPSKTEDVQSFNKKRSSCYARDYWDRTLYCIYNWYHWEKENDHEKAEKWLRILLLAADKIKDHTADDDAIVNVCIEWLKAFCDKEGKPSWDVFVEKNYLQDYTKWPTRPYGRPKEFWAGHFCGGTENALPQTPEQFEAFFTHATACIKARSARMVAALREMEVHMRKLTIEQIIEELSFDDALAQFVRFDEESDAFVYSITRTREDGSLAEELILYDGDMDDLEYAEEEAFMRQIARELRSGDAKLQFVRFDEERDASAYLITRTLKDGSLEEHRILFDGNMDELLSVLEDSLPEEERKTERVEDPEKNLDRMDCIFYLFIMDEEPSVACGERLLREIGERFSKVLDIDSYRIHSGAYIRRSAALKEEFACLLPVQAKIVIVYRKTGQVSLLHPEQRDMIFDAVMESVEDEDTVNIIKRVLESTPDMEEEWI